MVPRRTDTEALKPEAPAELKLVKFGYRSAAAHGLAGADLDDCAMEIVAWLLAHPESAEYDQPLRAIVIDHRACDFIRREFALVTHGADSKSS